MPKLKQYPKLKKIHFMQNWGSYSNQTFVCVDLTRAEIILALTNKYKSGPTIAAKAVENVTDDMFATCAGFVTRNEGRTLLWLKEWQNNWDCHETLMHECLHLIQGVFMEGKGMQDEHEAQAYQLEFLFRSIRLKLDELPTKDQCRQKKKSKQRRPSRSKRQQLKRRNSKY